MPGLSSLTSAVSSISSSVQNGISIPSSIGSSLTGAAGSALGKLTGAAGALGGLTGAAGSALGGLTGAAGAAGSALSKLTGAAGGLSGLAGAAGGLGGIASAAAGALGSLTSKIDGGKLGLAALASAGLSPAASAQLSASLNSLNSSSPFPIKMPIIGQGTLDRSEISASISAALGDSRVPAPNFSSTDDQLAASKKYLAESEAKLEKTRKLIADLNAGQAKSEAKKKIWHNLRDTLPEGDPAIKAAYQEYSDAWDAKDALRTQLINS